MQGQWYDTGLTTSSDTLIPGKLEVPDDLIERECLNLSCDNRETEEEAKRRVAEDHLEDNVAFMDDGEWETFPVRKWVESLR
jgi:hypothetical protein